MSEREYDHRDKFGYPEKWGQVTYRAEDGKPMTPREFMESIGLELPDDLGEAPPDARAED